MVRAVKQWRSLKPDQKLWDSNQAIQRLFSALATLSLHRPRAYQSPKHSRRGTRGPRRPVGSVRPAEPLSDPEETTTDEDESDLTETTTTGSSALPPLLRKIPSPATSLSPTLPPIRGSPSAQATPALDLDAQTRRAISASSVLVVPLVPARVAPPAGANPFEHLMGAMARPPQAAAAPRKPKSAPPAPPEPPLPGQLGIAVHSAATATANPLEHLLGGIDAPIAVRNVEEEAPEEDQELGEPTDLERRWPFVRVLHWCARRSPEQWTAAEVPQQMCGEGEEQFCGQVVETLSQLHAEFARYRRRFRKLGVLSGVPIEPPMLTSLLDVTAEEEGVLCAGVPGAGGYDAIFAICLSPRARHKVERLWGEWTQFPVIPLLCQASDSGLSFGDIDPTTNRVAFEQHIRDLQRQQRP
ncbi:putative phosphomevalonate kinase [Paratrimastix pyriformis]|uniref:Phosphomevalonate kinase n=1 Tax=Paratrimastix pyriformis TaxID=342808 RepID=A0ABQ8UEZ5_9EUKA|nr:putative phosphomevalonate kinase [Paratrimastix pyriformis]